MTVPVLDDYTCPWCGQEMDHEGPDLDSAFEAHVPECKPYLAEQQGGYGQWGEPDAYDQYLESNDR